MLWTVAAVLVAWILAATLTALPRRRNLARHGSRTTHLAAAGQAVWRDARRNPAQWALFVVVPVAFIITANAVTPNEQILLTLREHGTNLVSSFAMPAVHGATMAPIAIASLSAIVGLFVLLDSRAGDQRVALAGLRTACC